MVPGVAAASPAGQEQLLIGFRLGVASEHEFAAIGSGKVHVQQLHGREFLQGLTHDRAPAHVP